MVSITCIVSKNTRYHISKKWYKTKQFPENQESENQEFASKFYSYVISHVDTSNLFIDEIRRPPSTTSGSVSTSASVISVDSSSSESACNSKAWCWVARRWSFNFVVQISLQCTQTYSGSSIFPDGQYKSNGSVSQSLLTVETKWKSWWIFFV